MNNRTKAGMSFAYIATLMMILFVGLIYGILKVDSQHSTTFDKLNAAGCYDAALNFEATDTCVELAARLTNNQKGTQHE